MAEQETTLTGSEEQAKTEASRAVLNRTERELAEINEALTWLRDLCQGDEDNCTGINPQGLGCILGLIADRTMTLCEGLQAA